MKGKGLQALLLGGRTPGDPVKRHGYYISIRNHTQYKKPPFLVVSKETPHCPYCGKKLKFEDHVRRHRKLAGGEKEWFQIERYSCPSGCGLHRLLPDFLAPHKHYDVDIISECLNGSNSLNIEDYPCDKTKERWQCWISLNLLLINAWVFPFSMHFVFTSSSMLFLSTNITSSKQVKE